MYFFIAINIFLSSFFSGSDVSCTAFKTGKFKIIDEQAGTTIITRTDKIQIEEGLQDGIKMYFDIKWVDECTYILKNPKFIKGDLGIKLPPDFEVKSEIISTDVKSYKVRVTANFTDLVIEKDVQRID